jgi:hypothetical protein
LKFAAQVSGRNKGGIAGFRKKQKVEEGAQRKVERRKTRTSREV